MMIPESESTGKRASARIRLERIISKANRFSLAILAASGDIKVPVSLLFGI